MLTPAIINAAADAAFNATQIGRLGWVAAIDALRAAGFGDGLSIIDLRATAEFCIDHAGRQ